MKWLKKHPKLFFDFMLFLVFFIISFFFACVLSPTPTWGDQVWSYGFSYQISRGLIPYRDFNMVQTPLYFMIASIFITIFGNHMISTCLFDAFLLSCLGFLFYKMIGWKGLFPFLFFFVVPIAPYNLLCLVLFVLILYLVDKKQDHDYVIPFIVGLIFLTKQNIGVLLFLPMFYFSKHKIQSTCVFLIPLFLLSIYLLWNHAFFSFIDYVFLGLFEFSGNFIADYKIVFCMIVCFLFVFYNWWKSHFQDKTAFYLLFFLFALYPLFDIRHFSLVVIPILFYFMKVVHKKSWKISLCLVECIFFLIVSVSNIFMFQLHTENDLLYLKTPSSLASYLTDIHDLVDGKIENVYFDSELSFLLKMYYKVPINELDFILDGNLGYYSKKKIYQKLENTCQKRECIFLIQKRTSKESHFSGFVDYVKEHYSKVGEFRDLHIYSSK